ncbi:15226_t:CDS:2, partial [Racocetra persica]
IIEQLNNKEILIPEIEFDLSSLNDYLSNSQKSKTIDFEGIPKPKNDRNIDYNEYNENVEKYTRHKIATKITSSKG